MGDRGGSYVPRSIGGIGAAVRFVAVLFLCLTFMLIMFVRWLRVATGGIQRIFG